MRKLYYKSTQERRRRFQIYTSIVEDDGKKYAIKEAVFSEGKKHIENIRHNYDLLNDIQQGMLVACEYVEGKLMFPFISGTTLGAYLRDIILSHSPENKIKEVLDMWKQILIGRNQNIAAFDNSESFQKIFGNGQELVGDTALRITNFDCIAENIIMNDKDVHLIDYEWAFDFLIPLEFTFYRIIKMFFLENRKVISFEKLLAMAQIENSSKIELYEKMLDSFYSYITYEEAEGIDYANLGKAYKNGRVLAADADAQMKYVFPEELVSGGNRLILYGAGDVGLSYYHHIRSNNRFELVAWVDKRYEQYEKQGFAVRSVETIYDSDFDYIVIAIYNDKVAHEIVDSLESQGIDRKKIVWQKPKYV